VAELLIHSMTEFADIILGVLEAAGARDLVEIGAEFGGVSALLADYAGKQGGSLVSVDPAPKDAFLAWAQEHAEVRHMPFTSLEAIAHLQQVDAWLIDGDHNWYTVYHELQGVDALCRRDGKPLLAMLHDVSWPAARRDMYYAPDRIPAAFRHAYSYDAGTTLDEAQLTPHRGFRGMGQFAMALHEGGPRNGVLTAVEDFMAEQLARGRELGFAHVPAVFGLGILFDLDADWSATVAELVVPYHENKLIRSLEENRLRNYLRVIELQDLASVNHLAA
jgi:predicted O-methyltransferase YrrM